MNHSIAQHNTEWLYYQIIADITGATAYDVYEGMAARILKVIDADGDLAYIKPVSLDIQQHNSYMEQVRFIAEEFGITLPDPSKIPEQKYQFKKLMKQR